MVEYWVLSIKTLDNRFGPIRFICRKMIRSEVSRDIIFIQILCPEFLKQISDFSMQPFWCVCHLNTCQIIFFCVNETGFSPSFTPQEGKTDNLQSLQNKREISPMASSAVGCRRRLLRSHLGGAFYRICGKTEDISGRVLPNHSPLQFTHSSPFRSVAFIMFEFRFFSRVITVFLFSSVFFSLASMIFCYNFVAWFTLLFRSYFSMEPLVVLFTFQPLRFTATLMKLRML